MTVDKNKLLEWLKDMDGVTAYDNLRRIVEYGKFDTKTADTSSLITTIESQKEEIEKLHEIIEKEDNVRMRNIQMAKDIESLKAITELAVKGLKIELKDAKNWDRHGITTRITNTLSEIERLQNE